MHSFQGPTCPQCQFYAPATIRVERMVDRPHPPKTTGIASIPRAHRLDILT